MNNIASDIKNGDLERFKMIYAQYHGNLYYYTLKHTQSPYLAEETVQLTFIKLWEKRAGLSEDLDISLQLFRIARSTMIDLLRKESKHQNHTTPLVADKMDLPEQDDLLEKEALKQAYAIIEAMPPVRKKIFKLSRFDGLPHKEIAQQLSISPKTVGNHINRAIRQLKDTLNMFLF